MVNTNIEMTRQYIQDKRVYFYDLGAIIKVDAKTKFWLQFSELCGTNGI